LLIGGNSYASSECFNCPGDELLALALGHGFAWNVANILFQTKQSNPAPWIAILACARSSLCLGLALKRLVDARNMHAFNGSALMLEFVNATCRCYSASPFEAPVSGPRRADLRDSLPVVIPLRFIEPCDSLKANHPCWGMNAFYLAC